MDKMKIETFENSSMIMVSIQPNGFWTDTIKIRKDKTNMFEESEKPEPAQISWGSGGTNGDLNQIDTAISLSNALIEATVIAKELDERFGSK